MKRVINRLSIRLKKKNTELNKLNVLLNAILESSSESIVFALDKEYRYIAFNNKHKETMKAIWGKEIKIGMNILEIIGNHADRIKSKDNFDKALNGNRITRIEEYGHEHLSRIDWENHYAPIYSDNGEIMGLTCFVIDVSERIRAEKEVIYLSYHDELTGLYNRRSFYEELRRHDTERNFPISVILGDMNGLKLANDIFGHASGDLLLQNAAEVLKNVCRADDIVARTGGDEFAILLPKTTKEEAERIIHRIKKQFSKKQIETIRGSISMGCATKLYKSDDILRTLEDADRNMYFSKTVERSHMENNAPKAIIRSLHRINLREKEHSVNVSRLCGDIGRAMNLSEVEIRRLKESGFYHDIGKIALDKNLLNKDDQLSVQEKREKKRHAVVGYRILNSSYDTLDLAESVLAHHERWDGTGYPKGLKGEEIPIMARIIAVAEGFDHMTNKYNKKAISIKEAIKRIKNLAGRKYDPNVVDIFIKMINVDIKRVAE